VQRFARDGFGRRNDRRYGNAYCDHDSKVAVLVTGGKRLAEAIPGSSDHATARCDGDADSRLDLHNTEQSTSALGAGADDAVGARSWNHADVLWRRKFSRWWKPGRRRRNCSDRDPGRNIYDHSICERDRGFDHTDARREIDIGRAVSDLHALAQETGSQSLATGGCINAVSQCSTVW
jgi:hypothetical protein